MGFLHRSMTGAILILATILLRALALRRLPKATFRVLWMVAAARLLLPFAIPSRLSLYNLFPLARPSQLSLYKLVAKSVQDGAQEPGGAVWGVWMDGWAWQMTRRGNFWGIPVLEIIYFTGVGLFATYFLVSYFFWWKKFRVALPVQHDGVREWVGRKERAGLFVRVSDRIKSPLTYGIFRPVILLPKGMDWEDGETLRYILEHEYAHIRHCDTMAKLVFAVVLCMHWFNPAVWVMYFLANRDMELYCDETVVRMGGYEAREKYALALLHMEELKKQPFSLYSHFSGNAMEERIVAIMKIRKKSVLGVALAVGIVAGTTMLFATSAFAGDGGKEEGQENVQGTVMGGTVMLSATPTPAPGEEVLPEPEGEGTPGSGSGLSDQEAKEWEKQQQVWEKITRGEVSMVFVDENGEPDESGEHKYVQLIDQDGNVLLSGAYSVMGDRMDEAVDIPVWFGTNRNADEDYFIKE